MAIEAQSSFKGENVTGCLYLVPTPIGNLGDMTVRAQEVLQAVDVIAAEDTRNTGKLLQHFAITTPQISFHEHNTQERIPQLVAKMQAGQDVAQVSDAGMPSISDPGHELVVACIAAGIPVVPLPGPNAGLTALIASGLAPQPFYFYGFLPRKTGQQQAELAKLNQQTCSIILYGAPHRLAKTLQNIATICGTERQIVLCRELTKRYEEFLRGTVADALQWAQTNPIKGEFVLILAGNDHPETMTPVVDQTLSLAQQVAQLMDAEGLKPNQAIKRVAKENKVARQVVYNEFHHLD